MTIATLPAKKPRTRKPKADKPLMPWEKTAEKKPEPPKCCQCGHPLGWRDFAYVGKQATMCKVCHQKAERKRLRGVYVSPKNMPHAPMAYGTERTAKLTARPAWKASKPKAPPATQKATRQERSAKRTEKYLRRKAARQARKERAA